MSRDHLLWARRGVLALLCGLLPFPSARAGAAGTAGGPITAVVRAGSGLSITDPNGESRVTLSVQVRRSGSRYFLALPAFTARDTTGTGHGWQVAVQAAPLRDAAGDSLPAGSLSIAGPSVRCAVGTSCRGRAAPPAVTGGYPAVIDTLAALTLVSAAPDTGMGSYTLEPGSFGSSAGRNLRVTAPPGTAAGEYQSTLVFTIASGP